MEKIVFATSNNDKLKEIKDILGDIYEILSLKDIGFTQEIEENGTTFEENAMIKAECVAGKTNMTVLADDSGLEIDYLNKEPGIYSARYLGRSTPYSEKNKIILEKLKDVGDEKRTARFVCAIACVIPNKSKFTLSGVVEGIIAHEAAGSNGFGYDPIFYLPEYQKTTAELSLEEKNKISHRGKALQMIRKVLEKYI